MQDLSLTAVRAADVQRFGLSLTLGSLRMKHDLIFLLLLFCALAVGCASSSRAQPLTVPTAAQVTRITVRESSSTSQRTIREPNQIADVIDFFAKHNDGWYTRMDTFPTGRYAVTIYSNDRVLMVVWLGPDWIGGRDGNQGASDNRLRALSTDEKRRLERLLLIDGQAEQNLGRERRERFSQLAWCGEGCFNSRRRVNSTVMLLVEKYGC